MRRLLPALGLLLTGCGPWCGSEPPGLAGLAEFDRAAATYREAVLSGKPESEDDAHFAAMLRAAELAVAHAPDRAAAERALAARSARLVAEAGAALPGPAARSAAAERALRGWRRFVLPAHPEAARWLARD